MTRPLFPRRAMENEAMIRTQSYQDDYTNARETERKLAKLPIAPWEPLERTTLWQRLSEAWKATPLWERRFILGNLAFWGGALAVTWWF